MAMVFNANRSSVQVDGEAVEGLQSLTYRVINEREDIRAVGSSERIDLLFGLRTVRGEMSVKSVSTKLDTLHNQRAKFQVVANLKHDESEKSPKRTISFDDCYVEEKSFSMGANGTPVMTYTFSATRVREE